MNTKLFLMLAALGTGAALAQSSGSSGATGSATGSSAAGTTRATSAAPNVGTAGGANIGALPAPGVPNTAPTLPSRSAMDSAAANPNAAALPPAANGALPPGLTPATTTPGVSPLSGLPTSDIPAVSPGTAPVGPRVMTNGPVVPTQPSASPAELHPRLPSVGPAPSVGVTAPTTNLQLGAGTTMIVPTPPPAANNEVVTAPLSNDSNQVWVPGHYSWLNAQWTWVESAWQTPPMPGAMWIPGNYDAQNHRWTEGHWELTAGTARAPQPQR